jgi:hypothetical protein
MKIILGLVGALLLLSSIMGQNELARAFTVAAVIGAGLIFKSAFTHPKRTRLLSIASLIAVSVAAIAIAMVPGYLGAFKFGELLGLALGSWAFSTCGILLVVRAISQKKDEAT